jgi:hypothetical protein
VCSEKLHLRSQLGRSAHHRHPALTWQVLADNVRSLHGTRHGGVDDFTKLQPQACKSEPCEFSLFPTLKEKHLRSSCV